FRPSQQTDRRPLPVVASPSVAAAAGPGGLVTLNFYNPRLQARGVATARRFPSVGENEAFVIAGQATLATAPDADPPRTRAAGEPGTGPRGEVGVSVPRGDTATVGQRLAEPPYSHVERVSRRQLEERARNEPMARGFVDTLGAAAILALVLSVVGLWAVLLS